MIIATIIVFIVRVITNRMNIALSSAFNWKILIYIPWLLKEIWLSAISVIKIIWNPRIEINPVFEYINTIQTTNAGMVLYANSITLTPGTYTLDLGERTILVHSLVKQNIWPVEMDKRIAETIKC